MSEENQRVTLARWEPDEIGAAVNDLLAEAVPPQKVYGT